MEDTGQATGHTTGFQKPEQSSAFIFHGRWQDFAKIAFTNMLLSIVTLGIYRFWATTREREYLWSQTQFIDERLEWTGTGKELFIGFIMVFFFILLPFGVIQLIVQGALLQGQPEIAGLIVFVLLTLIFYLTGVAYFRALRYRLSRTYWRGIRGGSDDPGFTYGLSYMWKSFAGALPLYLLVPWSSISLWNERWGKMSFGPHRFQSNAQWTNLMKRYLLFYLVPFLLFVGIIVLAVYSAAQGGQAMLTDEAKAVIGMLIAVFTLIALILLPLASLMYFSKFFRVGIGGLKLHNLEFEFTADSADWILFFLGNMAIVICTLGIGNLILPYRNWKFFITHLEAYGEINLDELTQSATKVDKHGEGLLDAFDVGAF